jgi:hypothetical protein
MRRHRFVGIVAPCLVALPGLLRAQQSELPIRSLGAIVATSVEPVGNSATVRPLSNGQLLVHDPGKRRVLLFDSTLQQAVVVADTTSQTGNAYGRGLTGLVAFSGDSSLMSDVSTGALLVLDPLGKVARIIRLGSRTNPVRLPNNGLGFDQAGHLVYRAPPPTYLALLDRDFVGDTLMVGPDSTAILRADLATGRVDTLAMLKAPRVRQAVTRRGLGLGGSGRPALNPLPAGDDWTMLHDGTLAIVRVHDYRVDRVQPDRRLVAGPAISIPLMRITDSMKVALLALLRAGDSAATSSGRSTADTPHMAVVEPADLPDFLPPFSAGAARGDADGDVWVRRSPGLAVAGGLLYDVINRTGMLVDRVRLPDNTTLGGFGPGVAYLLTVGTGGAHLTTMRIR